MLAKLLKYEYKETARFIPFFYAITALFAAIAFIAKESGIGWFGTTSSVVLILTGIAAVLLTFVVVSIRFYKNLYSNEGYLMFTLPVKPHLLLISKLTAAFTWLVSSMAVLLGALLLGLYCMGFDFSEFGEILNELGKYNLDKVVYLIIPMVFIQVLYFLSMIYFSITFANKPALQGLGAAAAFLVFLAVYIILQIVYTVLTIFIPFSVNINLVENIGVSLSAENMFGYLLESIKGAEPVSMTIGLGGYLFIVVMIFVLFYLTGRMMNKKVSLK